MKPDSNQPARLYGIAKTNKFETLEDITVANLKFQPIIDQTGTFTYNSTKVISDYLRNGFIHYVKLNIASMIHKKFQACYLQFHLYKMMRKMHHMMSYDESLFTNILIQETINYITEQIYVHKS